MPFCSGEYRLMSRAAFSLFFALAAVFPRAATAQTSRDFDDSRAPRFLLAMPGRSEPVPVDLRRSTTLRYPLSLAFDGVTLKEALAEISRQARLSLVYADDVVPVDATVNLHTPG